MRVPVDNPTWGRLDFDVLVDGPADGETVILLHGFPETAISWRAQLDALAANGYRAVAPDQRGYSPGARPAAVEAYTGRELVGDVLSIADALGADRFHLVGHDWGGAVAWQVAGHHADRLQTLTVLSTPHPAAFGIALMGGGDSDQSDRSSYITMFREPGTELGMLANDAVGLKLIYLGSGMSEAQAAPYLDALGTPEALGAALNWYRAASLTDVEGLGPITMPTMYVWSTDDVALGRAAAEGTAEWVEGPYRFEVLEGVNHWIAESVPEVVNTLLVDHLTSGR